MKCPRCASQFGYRFVYCPYDGKPLLPEAPQLSPSHELPDLAGTHLESRVRVRDVLGHGAMGTVYLAQDLRSGGPVALKLFNRGAVADLGRLERFRSDAHSAAQVDHPNVARLFETGELGDGTPYVIAARLFGESLTTALEREGELPLEIAIPLLQQAAAALWAVHERGVVHRNIQPNNLYLVGQAGQLRAVELLDFGVSQLWKSVLSADGEVYCAPQYVAPEQVVGAPTDQRTDVYALGMVMYQMMTGREPFPDTDKKVTLACQLMRTPPAPKQLVPDLEPNCDLVIRTATHKRPELRYASMQLFAEDLKRLEQPKATLWAREAEDEPFESSTPLRAELFEAIKQLLTEADGSPHCG